MNKIRTSVQRLVSRMFPGLVAVNPFIMFRGHRLLARLLIGLFIEATVSMSIVVFAFLHGALTGVIVLAAFVLYEVGTALIIVSMMEGQFLVTSRGLGPDGTFRAEDPATDEEIDDLEDDPEEEMYDGVEDDEDAIEEVEPSNS